MFSAIAGSGGLRTGGRATSCSAGLVGFNQVKPFGLTHHACRHSRDGNSMMARAEGNAGSPRMGGDKGAGDRVHLRRKQQHCGATAERDDAE